MTSLECRITIKGDIIRPFYILSLFMIVSSSPIAHIASRRPSPILIIACFHNSLQFHFVAAFSKYKQQQRATKVAAAASPIIIDGRYIVPQRETIALVQSLVRYRTGRNRALAIDELCPSCYPRRINEEKRLA